MYNAKKWFALALVVTMMLSATAALAAPGGAYSLSEPSQTALTIEPTVSLNTAGTVGFTANLSDSNVKLMFRGSGDAYTLIDTLGDREASLTIVNSSTAGSGELDGWFQGLLDVTIIPTLAGANTGVSVGVSKYSAGGTMAIGSETVTLTYSGSGSSTAMPTAADLKTTVTFNIALVDSSPVE